MRFQHLMWVLLASTLLVSTAMATDQRANALMYNLGIEDDTDMILFPHLADRYTGIYFDAPPNYTDAFGGAVFNVGKIHLGIFVNRSTDRALDRYRMQVTSNQSPISIGDRFNSGTTPNNAGQTFSRNSGHPILFLADMGDYALSARIRMWPGAGGPGGAAGAAGGLGGGDMSPDQRAALMDGMDGAGDGFGQAQSALTAQSTNQESGSAAGIDLGVSWEWDKKTDAAVNIGHVGYTDVGAETNLDFTTRHWGQGNTVLVGAFQLGVWSPDNGDGDYFIGVPVKYGWLFNEDGGRLKGAVLTGMDLQVTKVGAGDGNTGVGLPIVELAAEYRVADWMFVRSGVKGGFGLKLTGDKGYSDQDKLNHYEQTEFNSGVGFAWRQFRVDAALSYSTLNTGPHFVGGQAGGPFFGGISLAYLFDANTNAGVSAPAEEAPPVAKESKPAARRKAPVVAPAPAPAPAPAAAPPAPPKSVDSELEDMRKQLELEKLRQEMRKLKGEGGAAPAAAPASAP